MMAVKSGSIFCVFCGAENPGFGKFCCSCGAALIVESHSQTNGSRSDSEGPVSPERADTGDTQVNWRSAWRQV
jgi:hypothetical protein